VVAAAPDVGDPAAAAVTARKRESWPDVYRGIAIIAVVLVHCSGHVLSRLSPCAWAWYPPACFNRALQFAVPSFLLVSAYLNAGSLLNSGSRRDWLNLIVRRLKVIGPPYLLASLVGTWLTDHQTDTAFSARHFLKAFLLGRCAYHLYFVVIIVQLYLLLPLLAACMNGFRIRLSGGKILACRWFENRRSLIVVLVAASALQLTAYAANNCLKNIDSLHDFREQFPSVNIEASLLWYVVPVALGLWLLEQYQSTGKIVVPRGAAAIGLIAFAVYVPLSVLAMVEPVNTLACQIAEWAFTASASLLLVRAAVRLSGSTWFGMLGRNSLTIYLAHPFIIVALDSSFPGLKLLSPWPAFAVYVFVVLAGSQLLASLIAVTAGRFRRLQYLSSCSLCRHFSRP
jgi:surface polysaccharide O-acyltransferase-like enzyme